MGYVRTWDQQQKHVYLTPSLQWTLSPGNFLKEQVWTESWLKDQESISELFLNSNYAKKGHAFVRKDKLKGRACSVDRDNLSRHHINLLVPTRLVPWDLFCRFITYIWRNLSTSPQRRQFIYSSFHWEILYRAPLKCQDYTWFWGIKLGITQAFRNSQSKEGIR